MLGMANYYAKQKKLPYNKLNRQLQLLFEKYNIDSNKWDVIRKTAMETADDGMEFINIGLLDQVSDADIKKITGIENKVQPQNIKLFTIPMKGFRGKNLIFKVVSLIGLIASIFKSIFYIKKNNIEENNNINKSNLSKEKSPIYKVDENLFCNLKRRDKRLNSKLNKNKKKNKRKQIRKIKKLINFLLILLTME